MLNSNTITTLALLLTAGWQLEVVAQQPTLAGEAPPVEYSQLPSPPTADSTPAPGVIIEPAPPAFVMPMETTCHPIEVIRETASLSAKRMYRCHGAPVHQTLCVKNPADCTGCLYAVPVCVPACCVGPAECCGERVGLLGRGYATYRWPCGFEVEVVFRVHGGVILRYR